MAKRENAEPKRTAGDENADPGARKIQDDGGNHQGERRAPKDPAFAPLAKVVLAAGQNHDRSQAEKVSGLIAIRKWAEVAFVVPQRRRGFRQPE